MSLHCPGRNMPVLTCPALTLLFRPNPSLLWPRYAFSGFVFQFVVVCPFLFHVLSTPSLAPPRSTCHSRPGLPTREAAMYRLEKWLLRLFLSDLNCNFPPSTTQTSVLVIEGNLSFFFIIVAEKSALLVDSGSFDHLSQSLG